MTLASLSGCESVICVRGGVFTLMNHLFKKPRRGNIVY